MLRCTWLIDVDHEGEWEDYMAFRPCGDCGARAGQLCSDRRRKIHTYLTTHPIHTGRVYVHVR